MRDNAEEDTAQDPSHRLSEKLQKGPVITPLLPETFVGCFFFIRPPKILKSGIPAAAVEQSRRVLVDEDLSRRVLTHSYALRVLECRRCRWPV